MSWKPHVTVAAVIEHEGRFLLVEEETPDGIRLNQPAGHLEKDETLIEGVCREVWEETAYRFEPHGLLGVYHWRHPQQKLTYLRFAFVGEVTGHDPARPLDVGILRTVWLSPAEIRAAQDRHRSPQVLKCVEHYLAGQRFPLSMVTHL
ncbi:MAG: NUDIX hydrolase [Methylophilaceae bacterium]|nr:NUDIX hydrolase [Methylophilaceae bacterium]